MLSKSATPTTGATAIQIRSRHHHAISRVTTNAAMAGTTSNSRSKVAEGATDNDTQARGSWPVAARAAATAFQCSGVSRSTNAAGNGAS